MNIDSSFFNRDSFNYGATTYSNRGSRREGSPQLFNKAKNKIKICLMSSKVEKSGKLSGFVSIHVSEKINSGKIIFNINSVLKSSLNLEKRNDRVSEQLKKSKKMTKLQDEILAQKMEIVGMDLSTMQTLLKYEAPKIVENQVQGRSLKKKKSSLSQFESFANFQKYPWTSRTNISSFRNSKKDLFTKSNQNSISSKK